MPMPSGVQAQAAKMMSCADPEREANGDADQWQSDAAPAAPLAPGLYIVATPIGNLGDITLRALDVLRGADLLACEDTRVTAKLLARYGIRKPTTPYHDMNAEQARPRLVAQLREGARIALVSDAGTPLISDPGYKLVRESVAAGIAVIPVPGPSSVLAALMVAGLPTDRFLFVGFLPARSGQRVRALEEVRAVPATLVVLESTHRLAESLADMAAVLGPRAAVVARELTKRFEETVRAPLPELAARYATQGDPKGEVVVVIAPPAEDAVVADDATVDALLAAELTTLRPSDAAARIAQKTGRPRREVYARAMALRKR